MRAFNAFGRMVGGAGDGTVVQGYREVLGGNQILEMMTIDDEGFGGG